MKRLFNILPIMVLALSITSCDLAKNQLKADRSTGMDVQDYRDALAPRLPEVDEEASAASIPSLQPYVSPATTNMKSMPLVSISVNQTVPLRDVLFELAKEANYEIELDPRIRGSIIFTAKERPFDWVIDRISDIAGLRYNFKDDILRVEVDTPYNKLYKIDYLSFVRQNQGDIRNDIGVVSGEGADTGSAFSTNTSSESDFWGEMEANLEQILDVDAPGALKTSRDPHITVADQNPNVQPVSAGEDGVSVQPPDAVLRVDSLPVGGEEDDPFASSQPTGQRKKPFSINKQSGIVNVYATQKQHKEVKEYLDLLRRASTAQVLIEAKILEVSLDDRYSAGIDWRALQLLSGEGVLQFGSAAFSEATASTLGTLAPITGATAADLALARGAANVASRPTNAFATSNNFVLGYLGNDIQAMVQAMSGFGEIHALASPRMTVLNNQSAVLTVATNQVFFEIDVESTTDEGVTETDIDSTIRNVPEGVLVNVMPSINLDDRTISLALRPTITRVVNTERDPGVAFAAATAGITGLESLIPELNVQEIDTVIKVNSGQPVVLGGLLQDRTAALQESVPVLGEMPLIGNLFRNQQDGISKTELVIFLKATILENPGDNIHNTDRDLYRKFSDDRRPFKL